MVHSYHVMLNLVSCLLVVFSHEDHFLDLALIGVVLSFSAFPFVVYQMLLGPSFDLF